MAKKKKKVPGYKLIISAVCVVVSCALIFSLVHTYQNIKKEKIAYAALVAQRDQLKKERSSLEKQVKNLNDDDYVVKYARDHYIFTQGSEKAVVLPDTDKEK